MKDQILLAGNQPNGNTGPAQVDMELKELETEFEILYLGSKTRAEFFQDLAPDGKYSNIKSIYRMFSSLATVGLFDAELISHLPPTMKFLVHQGAGYDQIDIQACTKAGIAVSNTPTEPVESTATTAMFLIISAMRGFWYGEKVAHEGRFKQGVPLQNDPEEKLIGIIGFGGIGQALAKRALAFDMKIQYHNRKPVDPKLLEQFPAGSIKYCESLDNLLSTSDVVFLSIPLNAKTTKFMDKAKFDKCKQGACFINTARGGVVDEEALIEALNSGKLKTAGLDVYPSEPTINPLLLQMNNVVCLPHQGTHSFETEKKMELTALKNIKSGMTTGKLINIVPEQVGLVL